MFHPAINVSDMAEAVRYYRDLLGLRVTFDDDHDPAAISACSATPIRSSTRWSWAVPTAASWSWCASNGRRAKDLRREVRDAGILSVNLRVTDIDAMVERLTAGGYPLVRRWCPRPCPTAASSRSRSAGLPTA